MHSLVGVLAHDSTSEYGGEDLIFADSPDRCILPSDSYQVLPCDISKAFLAAGCLENEDS